MATDELDTNQIKDWRSIVTLIVFVITNIVVLFPFQIPVYIPRAIYNSFLKTLSDLRIISKRQHSTNGHFVRLHFPLNFVTAPLVADLFLLVILAIGRTEVHDGTIGANNISPIDIMAFFLSLAYIAISIDASGLIRYLAFRVLLWGGDAGHRLFFYLYAFFFGLGSFIGNDPIILSGTAFLAYMTRVSSNIKDPKAWIHTQFSIANIASAILVSSNPTNLVLSGAFEIKFIHYTANIIVPVVVTAVVLFPFLLYVIFNDKEGTYIPNSIKIHELPAELRNKPPVNPNIPNARGEIDEDEGNEASEQVQLLSLEEIMNPFVDRGGAAVGAIVMTVTLVTLLALNAAAQSNGEYPVFWVTLPAAVVMFCWDVVFGWKNREATRATAKEGRRKIEEARANRDRTFREEEEAKRAALIEEGIELEERDESPADGYAPQRSRSPETEAQAHSRGEAVVEKGPTDQKKPTLVSVTAGAYRWSQETFPTASTVLTHLPFALVPFALSMFVLVQALVTKGWVPVFAYGWDHWVNKTGTIGAVGGMGFLSVILCNFAGTNIGTTILLSRVIQAWQDIHDRNGIPITNRTFWATVYSMALGVNYGAFSAAFSASLAGLLWRDILSRKHIQVRSLDFARVNLPIIAIAMTVGCAVLVGQVYVIRDNSPYNS